MRQVFKAMILLGIFLPMQVYALGLGELHTRSYLNQPFDAELPLTTNNPAELRGLKVNLASPDDFSRAGIDRIPVLDALRFKVETKHGRSYIHITSSQVIREPYLNFLVEVNWSRGRLLREFTVLLDPPDLLGGEAANVESPGTSETPAAASKPSAATATPRRSTATPGKSTGKGFPLVYGPIKRNEKLWNIASKMRGDIPATVSQVMMALLRNNPEAFIDNNVNRVKSGFVLRIDNIAQINAMGPAQASKEFRHQYQLWLDYKQRRAAAAKKRLRERELLRRHSLRAERESAAQARQPTAKEGVLTLERPHGEKSVGGHLESESIGKGKESEELQRLQKELAKAQESAQSNQKQNEAMHDRLKAMEDQIAALQRLMSMRSDELTSLQQKLANQGQTPQAKPEAGFFAGLAAGFSAVLKKNPQTMGIIGGAVLLLLLTLWILMRRRKQAAGNEFYSPRRIATPAGFDVPMEEPWGVAGDDSAEHWNQTPTGSTASPGLDEDPITQADIFIAYGNLDAAIDVMETAVSKWPDKGDYQRKLTELKDKRAAAAVHVSVAPAEDLLASNVQESSQPASSLPLKEEGDEGALLTNEDLLAFEESAAANVEAPGADAGLLSDEDMLAFEQATPSPITPEVSDDALLSNDDLLAFETATQTESPIADEIPEDALLTNDDLLAFEEVSEDEAPKPTVAEHDDIHSAISDFGFELGEDLDLHEPSPAGNKKPQEEEPGLEYDLSDIHSELEQLTVDEGHISASEHESSIPEFDLQDLDDEFDLETAEAPAQSEAEALAEDNAEQALQPAAGDELDEEGEIDLDLELPDEEALGLEEGLDFDTDSLIELPDHEPDLLNDVDEVGTKLDLARAYIDMGDPEGARAILDEVLHEGNSHQVQDANNLLAQLQ